MRLIKPINFFGVTTRSISWIMSLSSLKLIAMLTVPDKNAPKADYMNAVLDVAHGARRLIGLANQGLPISRAVGTNIARVFDLTFKANPAVMELSAVLSELADGETLSPKKAHQSFQAANSFFDDVRALYRQTLGLDDKQKTVASPSLSPGM